MASRSEEGPRCGGRGCAALCVQALCIKCVHLVTGKVHSVQTLKKQVFSLSKPNAKLDISNEEDSGWFKLWLANSSTLTLMVKEG